MCPVSGTSALKDLYSSSSLTCCFKHYISILGWLHFLCAFLLGRCLSALARPILWSLHHDPALPPSCSGLSVPLAGTLNCHTLPWLNGSLEEESTTPVSAGLLMFPKPENMRRKRSSLAASLGWTSLRCFNHITSSIPIEAFAKEYYGPKRRISA